jgi:hypothetical protein
MYLLMSEIEPIDVAIDRAIASAGHVDGDPTRWAIETDAPGDGERWSHDAEPAWYEPRLSELRQHIAGC